MEKYIRLSKTQQRGSRNVACVCENRLKMLNGPLPGVRDRTR